MDERLRKLEKDVAKIKQLLLKIVNQKEEVRREKDEKLDGRPPPSPFSYLSPTFETCQLEVEYTLT